MIRLTRSKQTLTVALFLSAKRIALSFEGTPDVPADLRKRERHPWAPVDNRTLTEARGLPFKDKPTQVT